MKTWAFAFAALAGFSGTAVAADMAPRTYAKAAAPVVAPVANWTGCYVGGGGGYGMWNQNNTQYGDGPPRVQATDTWTNGGKGYFGTVQAGCDYQFDRFAIGAFGDYDFSNIHGPFQSSGGRIGDEKLSSTWAVGGRVGWVALPGLLAYLSGGYTEAHFDQVNIAVFGFAPDRFFGSQTYKGFFIGAGDEYALSFLPGLFWKTEYRFSDYDTKTNLYRLLPNGVLAGNSVNSHKYVHSVRSELIYRFNWGSPVVAKY